VNSLSLPAIITLATLKEGNGRSSLAGSLALHWRQHQETPALIDVDDDPATPQSSGPLASLTVRADPSEGVGTLARRVGKRRRPVIIDTRGKPNRATMEAFAASDLALVPVEPTARGVKFALQTWHLVREINATRERADRPITIRFVLMATNAALAITHHIRQELKLAGFTVLDTEIVHLSELSEIDRESPLPQRSSAQSDIAHVVQELERLDFKTAPPRLDDVQRSLVK
jgi:chromosome partitioning protein